MYDDGVANEFERAHQKGLTRGFDLGWSYKGRFDRQLVQDKMNKIRAEQELIKDKPRTARYRSLQLKYDTLLELVGEMKSHPNNRENITFNSW